MQIRQVQPRELALAAPPSFSSSCTFWLWQTSDKRTFTTNTLQTSIHDPVNPPPVSAIVGRTIIFQIEEKKVRGALRNCWTRARAGPVKDKGRTSARTQRGTIAQLATNATATNWDGGLGWWTRMGDSDGGMMVDSDGELVDSDGELVENDVWGGVSNRGKRR